MCLFVGHENSDPDQNSAAYEHMGGSREGTGGPDPPEKSQKYINIGPNPLKKYKATKPAFYVGPSSARQRNAAYCGIRILSPLNNKKKTLSKLDPFWQNFLDSRMEQGRHCLLTESWSIKI